MYLHAYDVCVLLLNTQFYLLLLYLTKKFILLAMHAGLLFKLVLRFVYALQNLGEDCIK